MTLVDAETIRIKLTYDPETGIFEHRNPHGRRMVRGPLGCLHAGRYRAIRICGGYYLCHRLAWLYMTGAWPEFEIDHIDGDGLNNRFANLRVATHGENMRNARLRSDSTSGRKGVQPTRAGRWTARIRCDGKLIYLGTFNTVDEAHSAYCREAAVLHGEFARVA